MYRDLGMARGSRALCRDAPNFLCRLSFLKQSLKTQATRQAPATIVMLWLTESSAETWFGRSPQTMAKRHFQQMFAEPRVAESRRSKTRQAVERWTARKAPPLRVRFRTECALDAYQLLTPGLTRVVSTIGVDE